MPDDWSYNVLISGVSHLGPGAESLIKTLTDSSMPPSHRVDIKKKVRQLTVAEWASVLRAFDDWPFAPEVR
jgi:transcription factor 1